MNKIYALMFIWVVFFTSLTIWRMIFLPEEPTIFSTGKSMIAPSITGYYSYTKGFQCVCDVLIECDGKNLINQTITDYIVKETNYSSWCR